MQSRFGAPGIATRYLITQRNFNAWAESVKPRTRALTAFFLMLVAVACSAAIFVMGPRLAREGALLWFGTHAEGVIKSADVVEVGKFKGGDPKYRLRLAYEFPAEDGTPYSGLTQRDDVRTPPELKPGDPIGVYYSPNNPLCAPTSMRCCCSCRGSRFSASWDRCSTCTAGGNGAAHQAP